MGSISTDMLSAAPQIQEYINRRLRLFSASELRTRERALQSATMETTADEMIRDIEDFLEGLT